MNFQLSEEQELFRRSVAEFVKKEVVPVAARIDWGYGDVHYCAAKAGIMGLAKRLAKDLAPYKINVNAVAPGSV